MATARPQVNWFRVPLNPELLKELNMTSDREGWKQAGGHLLLTAVTAAATIAVWHYFGWLWALPMLVLHGVVQSMLGSGVHELVHERVFTAKWLNRVFLKINSFLSGWNYAFYEISHKDHHRFTLNQPHDLEVVLPSIEALRNLKKETKWQIFVRWCQHLFCWSMIRPTIKRHWDFARGSYPHNEAKGGIWSQVWCEHLFSRMTKKEKRAIQMNSIIFLAGHGAIIVVSLAMGWWIVPFVIPLGYYFGGAVAFWTGTPQHTGLVDNVDDFRLCCRSYTCNPFFQYLYWNMNYHAEHHMYAAVPCYNLPRLHEAIKEYMPPIHTSLYGVMAEINQIAFRQRFDPSYQYRQPLPEDLKDHEKVALEHVEDKTATEYLDLNPEAEAPAFSLEDERGPFKVWECEVCGFIYDEAEGLPEEGLAPGTRWDDIPDDWKCPDCGVSKAQFSMIERGSSDAEEAAQEEKADEEEDRPLVIVGSGLSGYTLAKEYRKHDADGKVILLTRDQGESYPKPQLSNALAKGKQPEDLVQRSAEAMAESLNLEVRTGVELTAIDREKRMLSTSDGDLAYRDLVLAIGASQRQLKFEGDAADDVLTVNHLDDYKIFRKRLSDKSNVILLGGGLIGCEFANDLVNAGHTVDVVDPASAPLSALIPEEAGVAVKDALAEKGVTWHFGKTAARVDRKDGRLLCTLSDGTELTGDLILSATGLVPCIELAKAAGLDVNRGIVTDGRLRTSDARIYALGDCAEVEGRIEPYIAPLRKGAEALGATLAGLPTQVETSPMPVIVKTPACPVCVLPVDRDAAGEWKVSQEEKGVQALFEDGQGRLLGFVLTGGLGSRRKELLDRVTAEA